MHFTAEIDLTEIERVRDAASASLRPTYTAFVAKASPSPCASSVRQPAPVQAALAAVPVLLPVIRGTDVAVAIERNIEGQAAVAYIEVLRDVHEQTLEELTERLRAFSAAT